MCSRIRILFLFSEILDKEPKGYKSKSDVSKKQRKKL